MERRTITTPRLSLVPSATEHAPALSGAVEASLSQLRPWMPWAVEEGTGGRDLLEENRDFLRACETQWSKGEGWNFTIFLEGNAAGSLGLAPYEPLLKSAELGYWLRSDLAGRGLMTEAATAVVRFGFEDLGLHRIELHAGVNNRASIKVAEKLGFHRAGLLRDGSRGENGWYDCYVFDLLETDPREPRPE